jgi:outer membrane protein assembly factor BamE
LAAALTGLSACSSINNATSRIGSLVSPYKVEVVQGNFVSKEQRDALAPGMPKAQVRDILGSPLVTSVFHADRWDYVFTIQRQGQAPQQRKLTVFFRGDELLKVEGDELISEDEFVTSLAAGRRLGKVPLLEVPPEVLREFGLQAAAAQTSSSPDAAARAPLSAGATNYPPLEAPGAVTSAWDASTQRAVAASSVARSAAPAAAAAAPILLSQAPAPAAAPASAAASPAPRPAAPALAAAASAPPAVPAPPVPAAAAPVAAPTPAPSAPAVSAAPAPVVIAQTPVAPAPTVSPAAAPPRAAAPAPTAPVAVAPVAAAPAVAPVAPAASPAAPAAAPVPAPVAPPPASSNLLASADPDITTLLNRWTTDWQSRNVAGYFSHYVPEFRGTSATRAEWEELRRTRIEGRTRISLAALDVRVRMVSPTEARLVFRQVFESDAYTEIGTKAMFLIKRDGRWLIEREFFTPAQ